MKNTDKRKGLILMANKANVVINNNQKTVKVPKGLRLIVRKCCKAILETESFPDLAEIGVTFTDTDGMNELNRQYQLSEPSDEVVFFPTGENGVYVSKASNGAKILGNVVISLEKAEKTRQMHGVTLEREVGYLTAHGVFGLLGYCPVSSEPVDRMALRDKVEDIMDLLGLPASPGYAAAR